MKALRLATSALALGLAASLSAFAETGVTESTVTLGMSVPLSGPSAGHGKELQGVVAAYFDQVNKAGGVNGRKIELVALDDGYETERTLANTKALLETKKVFALVSYYGSTPTTEAMNQAFGPAGVPLVGTISGAQTLRQDPGASRHNRFMFNLRASYADEVEAIANQLVTLGLKNIAVFYQNDGFGKAGLDGLTATLKKHGLAPSAVGSVERNSDDVAKAVEAIAKANPQAVVMVTLYKPTAALVRALRKAGQNPMFMTLSPVGGDQLFQELGNDARGIGISQVMPYPWNDTVPVVKDYQRLVGKQGGYSYMGMEAYVTARVAVEAMKRAGKDLTREKLVAALEGLNQDIGGFRVGFTPANHSGSRFVELTVIGANGRMMK